MAFDQPLAQHGDGQHHSFWRPDTLSITVIASAAFIIAYCLAEVVRSLPGALRSGRIAASCVLAFL
jgi:hypothetical protein